MIQIDAWIKDFLKSLRKSFGDRVWFVGLQGSYARGEATETSDIDVVVILDDLSASDVEAYSEMLDGLSHRELICGFISGKNELLNWEPSDLFQFYYDTKPIVGSLDELFGLIDCEAIDRAIKIGACNIYHGCVHNMLHEKSADALRGLYKSASFVLQAVAFKQTGRYIKSQRELIGILSPDDGAIAEIFLGLKQGGEVELEEMSATLLDWSKKLITMHE